MAMASRFHSSSSMATTAQPNCFSYDVFLSFRGEDTRKGFTDHLYTALKQAGIHTFRDDDAMERGKLLKPELQKAIHQSAISLIVFSEGYASSKWCLDEVLMIMKEHETSSFKHEVVPVFYKVEPSDVRNQTGSFKDAFDAYDDEIKAETDLEKKRELLEKVEARKASLRKAANLTGLVLMDGYESIFIKDIVNDVIKKLDYKVLYIGDKLVGIEDHVAKIESWLQNPSLDAVVLLINGMGGIGKSTIAKYIFNLYFHNYDASCFLAEINETSNLPRGLLSLQSQLLSKILKSGKEETIWNVDEGTYKIINALSNKNVLLILDDVETYGQLAALLGPKKFHPGSKVIITTRNTSLLTAFKYGTGQVHSVPTLSECDATKLFSLHAFHQHQPVEPYIDQSEEFVRYCKGLPLALKVLGSSLCGKKNDEWKDTMDKLAAIPHTEIQQVLQISYENLADDKDKDVFLHIACFFEGETKDYIVTVLTACNLHPLEGIRNLMDRCLLSVDQYGRVMMHQLIKEMGREVVRTESIKNPGERSRLWHYQDCVDALQDHSGTEKVEGFKLDMPDVKEDKSRFCFKYFFWKTKHGNDAKFQTGALGKMENLTLLQLKYVTFSGKYKKLPKKLRLLSWHGFLLKAIPGDFLLEKLVVLDMSYSKLTRLWDDFRVIRSLKILNLSHCRDLIKIPDFGGLPGLEHLILTGCSSLKKVDKSIALTKLRHISLNDCRCLKELRSLPISLEWLFMCGCVKLKVLGSIENLTKLCGLFLSDCRSLTDLRCLPTSLVSLSMSDCVKLEVLGSLENLTELCWLDLRNCGNLRDLGRLPTSLEDLDMSGCRVLRRVQSLDTVSSLSLLEELDLSHSSLSDDSFPDDWSSLVSLVKLNIDGNYITFLPKCIQTLPRIEELRVEHCSKLQSVLGLPKSVNHLFVNGNESLEKVQLSQDSRTVVHHLHCPKLCEIEGRYKFQSSSKVERKIIRYMGIESSTGKKLKFDLQVFHEFGILSTFVSEKQIPLSCGFSYKERGSQISFTVPLHRHSSRIIGFTMCVVLSLSSFQVCLSLEIGVQNKTKDLFWSRFKSDQYILARAGKLASLSYWRCGNLLEGGDEIIIDVCSRAVAVEECCINLIYEEEDEQILIDGERMEEAHHVNA